MRHDSLLSDLPVSQCYCLSPCKENDVPLQNFERFCGCNLPFHQPECSTTGLFCLRYCQLIMDSLLVMRLDDPACLMRPRYFRWSPWNGNVPFFSQFHNISMPLIMDLLSAGAPKAASTSEDVIMMPDVEQGTTKSPGTWQKIRYSLDMIYTPRAFIWLRQGPTSGNHSQSFLAFVC